MFAQLPRFTNVEPFIYQNRFSVSNSSTEDCSRTGLCGLAASCLAMLARVFRVDVTASFAPVSCVCWARPRRRTAPRESQTLAWPHGKQGGCGEGPARSEPAPKAFSDCPWE